MALDEPRRDVPLSRQVWKLASIAQMVLVHSLLPINLADFARTVAAMNDQLQRTDSRAGKHQRDRFRNRYAHRINGTEAYNC